MVEDVGGWYGGLLKCIWRDVLGLREVKRHHLGCVLGGEVDIGGKDCCELKEDFD